MDLKFLFDFNRYYLYLITLILYFTSMFYFFISQIKREKQIFNIPKVDHNMDNI